MKKQQAQPVKSPKDALTIKPISNDKLKEIIIEHENLYKGVKERPENYSSPIIGQFLPKTYLCTKVELRSKGSKIAIFHEIYNEKVDTNRVIPLYFSYEETCVFEEGKKYNLTMSEV
jgi:hypothetical protein